MGNNQTYFSKKELNQYRKVTFLTDDEVIKIYEKYFKLVNPSEKLSDLAKSGDIRLSYKQFESSAEFRGNPFRDRLYKVFTTNEDEGMTFDDYLNLMSVFSEKAPSSIKCRYAFEIYKFDERNKDRLTKKDIKHLIIRLIGKNNENQINEEDMTLLINKMTSIYAKRIAQLSARIFGQINLEKQTPNANMILRLAQKPIDKTDDFSMNYYPRHQELDHLFKTLRYHGLYRDELRDFKEEIERLKKLRGKGKRERKPRTDSQ